MKKIRKNPTNNDNHAHVFPGTTVPRLTVTFFFFLLQATAQRVLPRQRTPREGVGNPGWLSRGGLFPRPRRGRAGGGLAQGLVEGWEGVGHCRGQGVSAVAVASSLYRFFCRRCSRSGWLTLSLPLSVWSRVAAAFLVGVTMLFLKRVRTALVAALFAALLSPGSPCLTHPQCCRDVTVPAALLPGSRVGVCTRCMLSLVFHVSRDPPQTLPARCARPFPS